jgi:hypothetical protein
MNDSTTRRHTGDAGDMYFTAVIGPAETPTSALALLDIETADDIDAKLAIAEAEAVRQGFEPTDEGREIVRRELRDTLEA